MQRAGRIDDALILRQERQFHGLTAGSDDGVGELDRLLATGRDDFEMMRIEESADAGRNLEEALTFLKRAVAIDPDNAAYLDSLGWAYFRLGRFGPARENLQKAVRLLPADPTMHEHLGDVEAADGRPDAAVQNWRQALKQGAESPERLREKIRTAGGDAPNESKAR